MCLTSQVGTKRYLAPEVLDSSINESDFESFKQVLLQSNLNTKLTCLQGDVYALGLVIWEVASRTCTPFTPCPPAQPPYWDLVGVDPSLDEMRKVQFKTRPILKCLWIFFIPGCLLWPAKTWVASRDLGGWTYCLSRQVHTPKWF